MIDILVAGVWVLLWPAALGTAAYLYAQRPRTTLLSIGVMITLLVAYGSATIMLQWRLGAAFAEAFGGTVPGPWLELGTFGFNVLGIGIGLWLGWRHRPRPSIAERVDLEVQALSAAIDSMSTFEQALPLFGRIAAEYPTELEGITEALTRLRSRNVTLQGVSPDTLADQIADESPGARDAADRIVAILTAGR